MPETYKYPIDDQGEISARDTQVISQSLLMMVVAAEKVTYECLDNPPPAGSPAGEMFQGDGMTRLMDAFLLMQYAHLSGFDHVRALVALVRTPTVRSTALATVTRGALESLARSWFLSSYEDAGDLAHRSISMLHSDLRFPARLQEPVWTRNGDPVDPADQRAAYAA